MSCFYVCLSAVHCENSLIVLDQRERDRERERERGERERERETDNWTGGVNRTKLYIYREREERESTKERITTQHM